MKPFLSMRSILAILALSGAMGASQLPQPAAWRSTRSYGPFNTTRERARRLRQRAEGRAL